jgi:hypothetical protein
MVALLALVVIFMRMVVVAPMAASSTSGALPACDALL